MEHGVWWTERWLEAALAHTGTNRIQEGRRLAEHGQVQLGAESERQSVSAKVKGDVTRPYVVDIGLAPFTETERDAACRVTAAEAAFGAALWNGRLLERHAARLEDAGAALFPASRPAWRIRCSCGAASPELCAHAAAALFAFATQLAASPLRLFALRGLGRGEFAAALRRRRSELAAQALAPGAAVSGDGVPAAQDAAVSPAEAAPEAQPASPLASAASPKFWNKPTPLYQVLAPAYRQAAETAERLKGDDGKSHSSKHAEVDGWNGG